MNLRDPLPIRSTYFICGTPRSGSTLLCDTLIATGVAGVPGEYFNEKFFSAILKSWNLRSIAHYDAYIDKTRRAATTPNGICGVKLHWPHLEKLANAAGCTLPDFGAIEAWFPKPVFVFLTRSDKRSQAFSHLRSEQTHRWVQWKDARSAPVAAEPRFDFDRIAFLQKALAQHEANWLALFDCLGVRPLPIYYEDLCTHYDATVRAVLRLIGVDDAGRIAIPSPRLQKQGGDESQWVQQVLIEQRRRREAA